MLETNWVKMPEFEARNFIGCSVVGIDVEITKTYSVEPGMTCAMSTELTGLTCDHQAFCEKYAKGDSKCIVLLIKNDEGYIG